MWPWCSESWPQPTTTRAASTTPRSFTSGPANALFIALQKELSRLFVSAPAGDGKKGEFQRIAVGESDIVFIAHQFAGAPAIAMWREPRRYNGQTEEDVVRYANDGYRANLFLLQSNRDFKGRLVTYQTPKEALAIWAAYNGKKVTWGESGTSEAPFGEVDWVMFQTYLRGSGGIGTVTFDFGLASCFSFSRAFAPTARSRGPAKIISGFFCNKPGEKPTPAAIQDLFSRLGVRGYAEPEPR